jgi:uncharacterized protein (DUF433 family)
MPEDRLNGHLDRSPDVAGGKARIAGRRVTVQEIAVRCEHFGLDVDEVAAELDLTPAQVHAALSYYFDHRAEIEASIRSDATFIDSLRERTPSLLRRALGDQRHAG